MFLLSSICVLNAQNTTEHAVKNGETLQSIAKLYKITVDDLKKENPGLDEYVFAGMMLKLPTKRDSQQKESLVADDDLKDVIYLKDNSELVVKIKNVDANAVTFEQYDTNDLFSLKKELILSITYEDGRTVTFNTASTKNSVSKRKRTR